MQAEISLASAAGKPARRFLRHFAEMLVVMMLGMCVLGAAFEELHVLVFGSSFETAWHDHLGLTEAVMAFNMTLPMVLWMRHRGHSWERGGEMAAAMNLPLPPLLVLYWSGVIGTSAALGLQMMLMLPGMLAAMLYRKEEYSSTHRRDGHRPSSRWFVHAH
jgi:hypothetical protein